MNYQCTCKDKGSLIPVRVGIVNDDGSLMGTVCFKQWCPKCGNSRLTDDGEILYYNIMSNGSFTLDRMNFWTPETVPFQAKKKFIDLVLKMANEDKFLGKQYFSVKQIRDEWKKYGSQTN